MSTNALFIGAMSGTSLDGVDAVLVELLDSRAPRVVHSVHQPYSEALRQRVLAVCQGQAVSLQQVGALDIEVAQVYASAVNQLLQQAGVLAQDVAGLGAHGQTVHHQPLATGPAGARFSMQLLDPNTLAVATNITVVADFRRRDMALGGQGAPLAPGFHDQVLRHRTQTRVVLNAGGIANISVLIPGQPCLGYDTGPANMLMDAWAQQHLGQPFDADGAWAATGQVQTSLLQNMLADPYFAAAPPKSTGREQFGLAWLQTALGQVSKQTLTPADVQRTLLELSCISITQAIVQHARGGDLLVCGGGARNRYFMQRLAELNSAWALSPTDEHGVPAQWMEAIAFAWFAKNTLRGLPGNVPSVTGASRACVLGGVYVP